MKSSWFPVSFTVAALPGYGTFLMEQPSAADMGRFREIAAAVRYGPGRRGTAVPPRYAAPPGNRCIVPDGVFRSESVDSAGADT